MRYLLLLVLLVSPVINAQDISPEDKALVASAKAYQDALDATYANRDSTILSKKQLRKFKTLGFYPIDLGFRVSATFKRTPEAQPFMMMTSAGYGREYVAYGILSFTLKEEELELPIYQNTQYIKEPGHKYGQSLFLPFTDYTSGDGSYGGGRYIDVEISDIKDNILIIDFNKSYNPYCAYTTGYACPIPPEANDLKIRLEAGIKAYDKYR